MWRARRWWASHGAVARVLGVIVGAVIAFFLLGIILALFGVGDEEQGPPPVRPSASSSSASPGRPDAPDVPGDEVTVTSSAADASSRAPEPVPSSSAPREVYYEDCDAARAAGAAPVYAGEPGYGPHLDRDGDGVACEPYVGP